MSKIKNGKYPAFPISNSGYQHISGMTKREYFTVMVLQGILSASKTGYLQPTVAANRAVETADALLKALEDE